MGEFRINGLIKNNISIKVLILEDSLMDLELMTEYLSKSGYKLDITHAEDEADFRQALQKRKYDIVLSDFNLPSFDAFGALELCQQFCPDIPFICVSGAIGEEAAIELLKKGAVDFVMKDHLDRLPFAVQRSLEEVRERIARIKTDLELKESENRFRQVAETAQEMIWEVDTKGMYTYASPVIETLLGYTPEEVIGEKYFYDFFIPENREELKKTAFDVFARREIFRNYENTNVHKNGNLVIVSTSGSPVFDDNGDFKGYRGVDQDITERIYKEDKLNVLSRVFEQAPVSIIVTNNKGEIEYANPKFYSVTGYKQNDVIGKNPKILKSGNHSSEFYSNMWSKISKGEIWNGQIQNKKVTGELFWENAIISGIKNSQDEISHYVAVKEDITEKVKAEEELVEYKNNLEKLVEERTAQLDSHNQFLRTLLDTIPHPVFVKNVDGRYTMVNKAFAKFYELPYERIINQTVESITSADVVRKTMKVDKELLKTPGEKIYDIYHTMDNGERREVTVYKSTFGLNPHYPEGVAGILIDVTDQKNLEDKTNRALKEALELSEMKTKFISMVSHQFRTPLTSILASADLLEMYGKTWSEEKFKDSISILQDSVKEIVELLNDVILLSRTDRGKIKFQPSSSNIKKTINKVIMKINKITKNSMVVNQELSITENEFVYDDKLVEEILFRLLLYVSRNRAEASSVLLQVNFSDKNLLFRILFTNDSEEIVTETNIFEPFEQADSDSENKGTGLDLAVVKQFVQLHEGSIKTGILTNKTNYFDIEFFCR